MHKPLLATFLTATIIIGFVLVFTTHYGKVQASTNTNNIPKPSIPEFTMKLVAYPYDVPSTPPTTNTTIDPYTGEENVITTPGKPGYHVENKSIEITIKNQPFTEYKLDNNQVKLFYRVDHKGHYEKDWETHDPSIAGTFLQSDSENTVRSITRFPTEGLIDYRVQALIGYFTSYNMPWTVYEFNGEVSGWSDPQTLTIPTPTEPPASPPTPHITDTSPPTSPALTEMEAIWGGAIIILVLFVVLGLLGYLVKRK